MKLSDLSYGQTQTLSLQPELDEDFGEIIIKTHEVQLIANGDSALLIYQKNQERKTWVVKPAGDLKHRDGKHNQNVLKKLLADNLPYLCWIVNAHNQENKTQTVTLQLHTFTNKYTWSETIDFAVDDKIIENLRKKRRSLDSVEEAIKWLTGKFLLPIYAENSTHKNRVFLSVPPHTDSPQLNKFRLYGQGYAIDLAKQVDNKLRVEKLVEVKQIPQQIIWLAEGAFKFCDMTVAGQLRGMAETTLDQIIRNTDSYLNIWQIYNKRERENILRRIREFGWLEYKKVEPRPYNIWRFHLHEDSRLSNVVPRLQESEEIDLEAAVQLPSKLQSNNLDSEEREFRRAEFIGVCINYSQTKNTIDLKPHFHEKAQKPPTRGVLFISLSGDEKRLERREKAKELIASARCPMLQLGLLLENQTLPPSRHTKISALSTTVQEQIGGQPTERQKKALDIALNTPDIALIQGPPGTGKTRVITALQARLAELGETEEGIGGQILLTSYQHDAVENAAERSSVFGLPAIKIGKRWGDKEENDGLNNWITERANAIRAKLATLGETSISQALRELQKQHLAYITTPKSDAESVKLLEEVRDWAKAWLPGDVFDRLTELQHSLKFSSSPVNISDNSELLLKAVRALRTQAIAFTDDGACNAYKLFKRLQSAQMELKAEDTALLEKAADWQDSEQTPEFLDELADLQARLLDRLTVPALPTEKPRINIEVAALLADIVDALSDKAKTAKGSEAAVLQEYLNDLADEEQMRETVRHYTAVFAATCQQAVGYQMSLAKTENTVFNSVIVDEAARANPLDLFIPLSRAKRRIVLVGDHRQLPHILEPDVERELEKSVQEETREALKQSLFERLFKQLREREKKDGIQRVVTLDKQYRMHPILGSFVSHTFYAEYGEGFSSGKQAEDFAYHLKGFENKVAAWIDIPFKQGAEKSGQSKSRPAEAKWLAKNLKSLMQQHPEFSFGVISFYAAQVNEILKQLSHTGLTKDHDGSYRIAEAWRTIEDIQGRIKERLRIGTVDAFQGKEFDVVILSMTRSNQLPDENDDLNVQNKLWRRKYGHLMLENRLCVAMSRQQRLLITLGDSEMVKNTSSKQAIPALLEFYQLCETEHGCIQ